MSTISCQICLDDVPYDNYINHCITCYDNQIALLNTTINNDSKESISNRENHLISSIIKKYSLTNVQDKAISFLIKKSRLFSKNTLSNAILRFVKLGYNEDDLKLVMDYIKNDVKLIVHFSLNRIGQYMISDTHYRNLFEVLKSSGNPSCPSCPSRVTWEDNLFRKIYHDAEPSERVKYGCLRLLNSVKIGGSALGYGPSYMILKDENKYRTSIVNGDSAAMQQHLITFDNCAHLLLYIDEKILHELIKVAKNKGSSSDVMFTFIEAQIHGDLIFSRDIDKLMIDPKEFATNGQLLNNICNHINIPYEVI